MARLLLQWVLSAAALLVISQLVDGFYVEGFGAALTASLVIGLLNATIGFFLKIITFPLSILTLGIFLLVVNALMILLASGIVKGFHVRGLWPAFWGAAALALIGIVIKMAVKGM
jgi:putative membrane protein